MDEKLSAFHLTHKLLHQFWLGKVWLVAVQIWTRAVFSFFLFYFFFISFFLFLFTQRANCDKHANQAYKIWSFFLSFCIATAVDWRLCNFRLQTRNHTSKNFKFMAPDPSSTAAFFLKQTRLIAFFSFYFVLRLFLLLACFCGYKNQV